MFSFCRVFLQDYFCVSIEEYNVSWLLIRDIMITNYHSGEGFINMPGYTVYSECQFQEL